MMNRMKCSCGRSPVDSCVGWGKLNEEEYLVSSVLWAKKRLSESNKKPEIDLSKR